MDSIFITICVCALTAAAISLTCLPGHLRRTRRKRWMAEQPSEKLLDALEKNVPLYRRLPKDLKRLLPRLAKVILEEKSFEGCAGLDLTFEMKAAIAGHASILLLGKPNPSFFSGLQTILVYPDEFYSEDVDGEDGLIFESDIVAKLGESWHAGVVILAWNYVKRQGESIDDGMNVVLHEFAHQLDEEMGFADGAPELSGSGLGYREWSEVMGGEYESLRRRLSKGMRDVLDRYGAESPAEFFAVATETFFERPHALRGRRPILYEELSKFYALNPAEWTEEDGEAVPLN